MSVETAARLVDPPKPTDDREARIVAQVADHGWRSTSVGGPPGYPGFHYTTGFWRTFDRPEIVTFDFPARLAHDLFGLMAHEIAQGRVFSAGVAESGLIAGDSVWFQPVDRARADQYLRSSAWYYRGAAFPCWQMLWGDSAGRFPWHADFDTGLAGVQPDLSAGGDWAGLATSA